MHQFDREAKIKKENTNVKISEGDLDVEKFDNPDASHSTIVRAPSCFKGVMKDYQLKGLRWLDNLYE